MEGCVKKVYFSETIVVFLAACDLGGNALEARNTVLEEMYRPVPVCSLSGC